MYMESRKMVLMDLSEKNRGADVENRLVDTEGKERERRIDRSI